VGTLTLRIIENDKIVVPLRGISGADAPQGNPKLDAKHTIYIL